MSLEWMYLLWCYMMFGLFIGAIASFTQPVNVVLALAVLWPVFLIRMVYLGALEFWRNLR